MHYIVPDICGILEEIAGGHPNRGSICRGTTSHLEIFTVDGVFAVTEHCRNTFDSPRPQGSYRCSDDRRPLQAERLTHIEIEILGPDGRRASCELLEWGSLNGRDGQPLFVRQPAENSDVFDAFHVAVARSGPLARLEIVKTHVEPSTDTETAAWERYCERCRDIGAAIEAAQTGGREYTVKTSHFLERTRRYHVTADSPKAAEQKVMEAYWDRKLEELNWTNETFGEFDDNAFEVTAIEPSDKIIQEAVRRASE